MGGGGGADAAKSVGAGSGKTGHAQGQCLLQQRLRHRVRWAAHTYGGLTTGGLLGYPGAARQDQGQRTGPKGGHQTAGKVGHLGGKHSHLVDGQHMHDQRVVAGPAFQGKHLGHGSGVVGVGPQAINRFGGQADQAPVAQTLGGQGHGLVIGAGVDHARFTMAPAPGTARLAGPHRGLAPRWRRCK